MRDYDKEMEMQCKLSDKAVKDMVADGNVDGDFGVALPGSSKAVEVKEEIVNEDVPKAKERLADLKPA